MYLFRHAIIVNGYVDDHTWRGIRHRNWGDDLNYYFIRQLTGRPVVMYHNFKLAKWLHLKNYLCIGTLLDAVKYANAQTIVWGSGVSGQERTFVTPKNILAVRGKKTKEFCDRYGVYCPEVYGDPALLLPLVYKASPPALPNREGASKKYRLGIIPHVVDQQHPVIREIKEKYADEILVIDLARYDKWTDVIDQICSCERILSSSLHGLIVSDVYQIPNCWIELTGNISGGHFKYYDYASSVNRKFVAPYIIRSLDDVENCKTTFASNERIKSVQASLISNSPFKLKTI
jgi:pyruvyltransferase